MSAIIQTRNFNLFYGTFHALKDVNIDIPKNMITSMIGPSGCGKSTLLRAYNRMNDLLEDVSVNGEVIVDGKNVNDPGMDLVELRKKVGMVFQRPNPFPLSVAENVLFSVKIHRSAAPKEYGDIIEKSLKAVDLWDGLKDKLNTSALNLSLEQQQRLCIARLLPVKPDILLMDEPCSALDPIATGHIEELMHHLKANYTIVIVTHNMQQAARVSDYTAYLYLGNLIEYDLTKKIFTVPKDRRTEDYLSGKFG
ncbi:MAG: phosphate ABC transporter ATP-binding protein [Candidatus Omnitrophica bacterium]|nr:phosphate ABC transporter ATP-binding protein [Candidatus Omnitrophota bacterium]